MFCSKICKKSKSGFFFVILLFLGLSMSFSFFLCFSNHPIALVWPATQSRNSNVLSRPEENTTLLAPSTICNPNIVSSSNATNYDQDLVILVIIFSAVSNFQERQAIRDSWASDTDSLPNIKVIFLLGTISNLDNNLQTNVTRESDMYHDILQENFIDSYANLTVKSLMLLKWFSKSCKNVSYVLKTDDDVYINLKNLHALVTKNKNTNLLMGSLFCGAKPIRDPYNKNFSPKYMYDKKYYPNYSHLSNKRDVTLTDFDKFHPPQKNPPSTFIDFLDFFHPPLLVYWSYVLVFFPKNPTLHVYSSLHVY